MNVSTTYTGELTVYTYLDELTLPQVNQKYFGQYNQK
jgi:hypothetical protein